MVTFLNTALLERGMITAASLFFVAYAIGLASVGLYWLVHGRSAASPGHRPS